MISNSYIFDNTHIGSNCVIERSIIGSNVRIEDNSNVPRGCLIADSVVIGPRAKLEPFDRLSARRESLDGESDDEEHDSDLEDVETSCAFQPSSLIYSDIFILGQSSIDKPPLGIDSNALVWVRGPLDEEEEEDEESPENEQNLRSLRIGESCNLRQLLLMRFPFFFPGDVSDVELSDSDSLASESRSESSESDSEYERQERGSLTAPSDTSLPLKIDEAETEFRSEVTQSLERAFSEGHSIDNAAVELKTLRMASNVSLSRVREAVISAIVERIPIVDGGGAPQRQEISKMINRWGELINKIGGVDPVETVVLLQVFFKISIMCHL